MPLQALDTDDLRQSPGQGSLVERTLNTATRIPDGLISQMQGKQGQTVGTQPIQAGVRPVQQFGSGAQLGQMFGHRYEMPIYSTIGAVSNNLPANVYDWNTSQWAQYFAGKGPSNTWDKDTWDMFNMVASPSAKTWYSNRDNAGPNPQTFQTTMDPGWLDLDTLARSPYQIKQDEAAARRSKNYGWGVSYANGPWNESMNPNSKWYESSSAVYTQNAQNEIARENALNEAYASLEKYMADKSAFETANPNKTYYDSAATNGMFGAQPQKSSKDAKLYNDTLNQMKSYLNPKPSATQPMWGNPAPQPARTMEDVRSYFGGTPLLDMGYSATNLPTYNPSFTVSGATDRSSNKVPWVNSFIKKEMDKQKKEGTAPVSAQPSSALSQNEVLQPDMVRRRNYL